MLFWYFILNHKTQKLQHDPRWQTGAATPSVSAINSFMKSNKASCRMILQLQAVIPSGHLSPFLSNPPLYLREPPRERVWHDRNTSICCTSRSQVDHTGYAVKYKYLISYSSLTEQWEIGLKIFSETVCIITNMHFMQYYATLWPHDFITLHI